MERAARLYAAFLEDTFATARALQAVRLAVSFAPADAVGTFEELAPGALMLPQVEGDLGARMLDAFVRASAAGATATVAIGADSPHLEPDRLREAFEELERHDLVLGPSADGGYYLIGLRAPVPALFDGIDWSTEQVLRQTVERARVERLDFVGLPAEFDVDSPGELALLRARIEERGPSVCPATAALLDEDAD